jgi:hypothetical protein
MASPVKLYQEQMHNNVGFFATWLPASILELGDFGVPHADIREGTPENMSYSASAQRALAASLGASATVPVAKAELSIRFSQQGGYVFEAAGIRHVEIADRMNLAKNLLDAYKQGRWQKEWLIVDAVYRAASATVIVSEDSSSEIVLRASGDVPLGPLPLADPKLGLSVSTSSGKVVHIVAQSDLTPLYSCLRVRDPIFGIPAVSPVRGPADTTASPLTRLAVEELLES